MREVCSRREALTRGAVLAAASAAVTLTTTHQGEAQPLADAALLNGLLAAEYQAIQAYDRGAGVLSAAGTDPTAAAALAVASHFQSQHREHAARLTALIASLGGAPVRAEDVTYTLPVGFTPTVANVLRLTTNAEKGAAIEYAEVLKRVSAPTVAAVVASIGGVEAQHFIVLHLLTLGAAAPTMTTAAMAREVVPRAFVAWPDAPSSALESVPDFTFG